ncbi:unnamed protein product [Tenebrio molitor]|nr:unnamed protein product [Tenebrio molitor]
MESNNLEGDDRTVTFSTSENVIHPYYNSLTLEHDIALIKLRMPVQYSSRNHPNKIRKQPTIIIKSKITLEGSNFFNLEDSELSNELIWTNVVALSNQVCRI